MESTTRSAKSNKALLSQGTQPYNSVPTTFFLKTEKEMERSPHLPSRSTSQSSRASEDGTANRMVEESSFGVESLEDTIRSTFSSDSRNLSRTPSNSSTRSFEAAGPDVELGERSKRRAGNRVHPTILAAGRRIISSEHLRSHVPASSSASPVSLPLTPAKASPFPAGSVTSSTQRSASPKSFRLSDEDSQADSQAIMSSDCDEDAHTVQRTPQLVMPSLAMPARRPFTRQGRQLGRAKIMVIGGKGVGKTHFINSIFRSSEHIIHVDQVDGAPSLSSLDTLPSQFKPTTHFTELQASTRPYPGWWTDVGRRPRSNSNGGSVLERNLTFIDTPGLGTDGDAEQILKHVDANLRRIGSLDQLCDSELVSILSGEGGILIDAIAYVFDPLLPAQGTDPDQTGLSAAQKSMLQKLCRWTNVVPVIGKADAVSAETLRIRKQQIADLFEHLNAETYRFSDVSGLFEQVEPFSISSALGNDEEIIDASVLMSSQYLRPLVPSELGNFIENLFDSNNIARMRHFAATKFLAWRREHTALGAVVHPLNSPNLRSNSPGATSTGSLLEDPSKVLIPHSSSSYYHSVSPAVSEHSGPSGYETGPFSFALTQDNGNALPNEPFKQVRLAKWAQDLRRSLGNERRRYQNMYNSRPSEYSDEVWDEKRGLVVAGEIARPAPGRLGGDLGIIDPRDPLGVLAFGQTFRRSGFFLLQLVGGFSLIGVTYWLVKNWIGVQEFFGFHQGHSLVHAAAIPAPRQGTSWVDDAFRNVLGWIR